MKRAVGMLYAALFLSVTGLGVAEAHGPQKIRVATFNASLNRPAKGQLIQDLKTPDDLQAQAIAETIQRVRPDVVLINEFDYDRRGRAAKLFRRNYLRVAQNGARNINYPYFFVAPSNTGVPTGLDLDNNGFAFGTIEEYQEAVADAGLPGFLAGIFYGNDAKGFGEFKGQFGMVIFSKYPIWTYGVRTFQNFKWKNMPGALLPEDPTTGEPWYSEEELDVLPLSSKSHWDIPIKVGREFVHILAAHPTPPVFDGAEDRNGRRNHDEIRFWADYISPYASHYIKDDFGQRGGLERNARFVIVGDYNADPLDGDSANGAILQLLDHPRVNDRFPPESEGGPEDSMSDGGINDSHLGDPAFDTSDFGDPPGNLRVDYALPSNKGLRSRGGGVFWPTTADPLSRLLTYDDGTGNLVPTTDHRLVYIDLVVKRTHRRRPRW